MSDQATECPLCGSFAGDPHQPDCARSTPTSTPQKAPDMAKPEQPPTAASAGDPPERPPLSGLLADVLALVENAPDDFAERYKSLHNRKRVDTYYVDRAVRKALLIMAEDIAEGVKKLHSMPNAGTVDPHSREELERELDALLRECERCDGFDGPVTDAREERIETVQALLRSMPTRGLTQQHGGAHDSRHEDQ